MIKVLIVPRAKGHPIGNCVRGSESGFSIIPLLLGASAIMVLGMFGVISFQRDIRALNDSHDQNQQVEVATSIVRRALSTSRSCTATFLNKNANSPGQQVDKIFVQNSDLSKAPQVLIETGKSPFQSSNATSKITVDSIRINNLSGNSATVELIFTRFGPWPPVIRRIPIQVKSSAGIVQECVYGDTTLATKPVCELLGSDTTSGTKCNNVKISGNLSVKGGIDATSSITVSNSIKGPTTSLRKTIVANNLNPNNPVLSVVDKGNLTVTDDMTANVITIQDMTNISGKFITPSTICFDGVCIPFVARSCGAGYITGINPNGSLVCGVW